MFTQALILVTGQCDAQWQRSYAILKTANGFIREISHRFLKKCSEIAKCIVS